MLVKGGPGLFQSEHMKCLTFLKAFNVYVSDFFYLKQATPLKTVQQAKYIHVHLVFNPLKHTAPLCIINVICERLFPLNWYPDMLFIEYPNVFAHVSVFLSFGTYYFNHIFHGFFISVGAVMIAKVSVK